MRGPLPCSRASRLRLARGALLSGLARRPASPGCSLCAPHAGARLSVLGRTITHLLQ